MHKGVFVYFIALIILVILAVVFYDEFGGSKVLPITTTTSISGNVTLSTTTVSGQTSTTSVATTTTKVPSTTSTIFSSCISKNATATIYNGDFSTGTYDGWNVDGPGFGTAPLNLTYANKNNGYYGNHTWSGYVGTFAATSFQKGVIVQAGNLTSNTFTATELYLNFKIISQQNALLYVQILENNMPKITVHYNTYASTLNASSTFANATIPLGTLLCQNLTVRLVAGVVGKSSQGTNYIAAGDFHLSRTPAAQSTQPANQTFS